MGYTLVPAFGRDYKSKAAVLKDWNDGKDFQIAISGQYCSIRDADKMDSISIRYNKKTQIVVVK